MLFGAQASGRRTGVKSAVSLAQCQPSSDRQPPATSDNLPSSVSAEFQSVPIPSKTRKPRKKTSVTESKTNDENVSLDDVEYVPARISTSPAILRTTKPRAAKRKLF